LSLEHIDDLLQSLEEPQLQSNELEAPVVPSVPVVRVLIGRGNGIVEIFSEARKILMGLLYPVRLGGSGRRLWIISLSSYELFLIFLFSV
jgi:hypothetical protein